MRLDPSILYRCLGVRNVKRVIILGGDHLDAKSRGDRFTLELPSKWQQSVRLHHNHLFRRYPRIDDTPTLLHNKLQR